ncbi:MAG: hypothetical protein BWX70_01467 [Verrucomicrobia bacterium ADurb.Bin070]|nr:MAG: hypothetical protein BWX70_01467 [Verrucomicrobia bacterium ADurb.Bin070]
MAGDGAGVHHKSWPGKSQQVRSPRGNDAAQRRQKCVRVGSGQGGGELLADLDELLGTCDREEFGDDIQCLVEEEGVLQPVDRGGVKGRRIPQAEGNAVCRQVVDGTAAVAQRVNRELDGEEDVLVFAGVDRAREILVGRRAGVEVAKLCGGRGEGTVKEGRGWRLAGGDVAQRGEQRAPLDDIPPESGQVRRFCEPARHAGNHDVFT